MIVPYYIACTAVIIFAAMFSIINNQAGTWGTVKSWAFASIYAAGDQYYLPFPMRSIGAIWFLWATFWSTIFLNLILKVKGPKRIFLVVGLFLIGYYSREIFWFPLAI